MVYNLASCDPWPHLLWLFLSFIFLQPHGPPCSSSTLSSLFPFKAFTLIPLPGILPQIPFWLASSLYWDVCSSDSSSKGPFWPPYPRKGHPSFSPLHCVFFIALKKIKIYDISWIVFTSVWSIFSTRSYIWVGNVFYYLFTTAFLALRTMPDIQQVLNKYQIQFFFCLRV